MLVRPFLCTHIENKMVGNKFMVNGDLDLMFNAVVLSYNEVGLLNIQILLMLFFLEFYLVFYVTCIMFGVLITFYCISRHLSSF